MRQLSLALYELHAYSRVPSRAGPRNRPAETPGQTCAAAPQQPEITAVRKPAPSHIRHIANWHALEYFEESLEN